MKALVKQQPGYNQMELLEVEEPRAHKNLVKIKVHYTGVCGTDVHTYKGMYANTRTPVTLGHEFSGEVVEIGEDVKNVSVGDRVTSETTFVTCGMCRYCKSKDYNLCDKRKGIGTQQDGSFAQYVITREESVHKLPDNVSYKAAALTEPLACCTHAAMEKTTINEGDVVLIVGPGPIGLLLAQVAKAQNATVILSGITQDAPRLALGKELGVDRIVDSMTEDLSIVVAKYTDGYGADKVFDCSGSSIAVNQALPLTAKMGTFVQVGIFPNCMIELDSEAIIQREIVYVGTRSQKPSSWELALQLLSDGKINTDKMITKIYPLVDWEQAFDDMIAGTEIKVLVES